MGTATAPVRGSGACPAWIARVEKPRFLGSPFTGVLAGRGSVLPSARFIRTAELAATSKIRRHEPRPQPMPRPPLLAPIRWEDGHLRLLDQTLLPPRRSGSIARSPSRSRTPSAAWPCAARRPSASPPPMGWCSVCAARDRRRPAEPLRRVCGAARQHPADGGEPVLGAGARARGASRAPRRRRRGGWRARAARRGARHRTPKTCAISRAHRRARRGAVRARRRACYALQRRRARHGRLRHGAGVIVAACSERASARRSAPTRRGRCCRARGSPPGSCSAGRHPRHADLRQHGRHADGAAARSTRSSSAPTASPPTATPPTRSAPTGRRAGQRATASRSTSPRRSRRSICATPNGAASRSRSASRRGHRGLRHAHRAGRDRASTPPSTSRRPS